MRRYQPPRRHDSFKELMMSQSNAAEEIVKIVPEFRKTDGARRMGREMPIVPDENKSRSFQVFVEGLLKLTRN